MYVTSTTSATNSEIHFLPKTEEHAANDLAQVRVISVGQNLFYEGDDADYIYEILSGVTRSSKILSDGRRQVLNFGHSGEIMGLSHDRQYHCDCDAISDVRVRVHHKNAFKSDMTRDPDFCVQLLKLAAAEVNFMQEHFIMLGRKSTMEKLASFLVTIMDRQSERHGEARCFNLPMNRLDIADFLGTTIETVSRNLTKLRKLGVIDLPSSQQVCVRNVGALRNLAEIEH